jgi:7-carboxy-7-deazaguanine synthase
MFGENPVRKTEYNQDGQTLWMQEVFGTIQGEGPFAGAPAIFVRLAGCNLRCTFCDTDFESSTWRPSLVELGDSIAAEYQKCRSKLVVITGGEPLRQNIRPFVDMLIDAGMDIQIETSGTVCPPSLVPLLEEYHGVSITIVCSPKTGRINPIIERYCEDFKYIIQEGCTASDGLPMFSTQEQGVIQQLYRPKDISQKRIWLQPMMEYHGRNDVNTVRTNANTRHCVELAMRHNYKVCVQLHKILNMP